VLGTGADRPVRIHLHKCHRVHTHPLLASPRGGWHAPHAPQRWLGGPDSPRHKAMILGWNFLQHRIRAVMRAGSLVMELIMARCLQSGRARRTAFRVSAVKTERNGNGFLHDIQPAMAGLSSSCRGGRRLRQAMSAAGVHLSAGNFLEKLDVRAARRLHFSCGSLMVHRIMSIKN